ncbi:hypothetical protein QQS21_003572 [Conoideocrella luteorostrata]|uniref:Mitochondrial carrier protein n=1 Tax=Conoideocrella luteorostrata TaxID=1105319 RepID=A0AAJ0CVL9_9HYPO|nr:hypothetical protein QQS21_003572 [Conoideocrella luteorostrata]
MSVIGGGDVLSAAAAATVAVDVVVHPVDTLITRIQSPSYKTQYRQLHGGFNRNLFRGLYQGFGPTLLAGVPASAAFFTIYEGSKNVFEKAQKSGHLLSVPLPIAHAVSSAVGDLVACAITNPAEVLKQNAQVSRKEGLPPGQRSHVMHAMRRFSRHPARLWTGYTMLVASSLPGTSLAFSLYEMFKAKMRRGNEELANNIPYQMKVSAASAALAAGCTSCVFVPVDVVKTRMRLAAGSQEHAAPQGKNTSQSPSPRPGPFSVAKQIFRAEGIRGLFRGLTLTFIASTFGSGLYLGVYEGCKLYVGGNKIDIEEFTG